MDVPANVRKDEGNLASINVQFRDDNNWLTRAFARLVCKFDEIEAVRLYTKRVWIKTGSKWVRFDDFGKRNT